MRCLEHSVISTKVQSEFESFLYLESFRESNSMKGGVDSWFCLPPELKEFQVYVFPHDFLHSKKEPNMNWFFCI